MPSPMASATAMYHSGKNPLRRVTRDSEEVTIPKGTRQRRLHKAFLRYHDAENWPLLREALRRMGKAKLVGNGPHHPIPPINRRGRDSRRKAPTHLAWRQATRPAARQAARAKARSHAAHRLAAARSRSQQVNAMRTMGVAGLLLAVGSLIGALAAHALQRVLEPRQIESLHTAVNYQLFNALGLLLIGLLMHDDPSATLQSIALALIGGIVFFSGGIT